MNLLAIDTSTHHASVALKIHDKCFVREEKTLKRHAEWVLPAVESVLQEAKIALPHLNGLVFGAGPGSFTGLRVACSLMKGLALPTNLPIYPVSSLASIAAQVDAPHVLAVIDARMKAWYWGGFSAQQACTPEHMSSPADINWGSTNTFILAGVGYEELLDSLNPALKKRLITCETIYPSAQSMIALVESGQCTHVSAHEVRPHYIQNPWAEQR